MRWLVIRGALGGCVAIGVAGCGTQVSPGGVAPLDASASSAGSSSGAGAASSGTSSGGVGGGDSGGAGEGGPGGVVGMGSQGSGDGGGTLPAEGGATGAGGAGDGGAGGLTTAQCNLLTTTLCTQGTQCVASTNEANCESQLQLEFGCGWSSGADYSVCFPNSQSLGCDSLFPDGGLTLPQTCLPPITATPLSDAQTKCYALVDALCSQSIQCLGLVATSLNVQNCEDDVTTNLESGFPCLLAGSAGAGYADCLAAIPNLACGNGGGGGDGGPEAGGTGLGMSVATVPSCANAITFTP